MKPASLKLNRILPVFLAVTLAACASGGPNGPSGRRGSSNRITAEELQQQVGQDLYQVVQRLRPQWLVIRGGVTGQGRASIRVVVDGVLQPGSVELLRGFRSTEVQEMRYVNSRDATTRYGTNMAAGAIEVVTKH